MPGRSGEGIKYANLTKDKPLFSLNAKDDPVFPYTEMESAWQQHKNEAPGWHFATVETGGHRFIYNNDGVKELKSLLSKLLNANRQE
jgi:predicted alpha/beta-fold hydrolase